MDTSLIVKFVFKNASLKWISKYCLIENKHICPSFKSTRVTATCKLFLIDKKSTNSVFRMTAFISKAVLKAFFMFFINKYSDHIYEYCRLNKGKRFKKPFLNKK